MNKSFMGKKLLSLLLSVLMCLSLIPSVALATTAEGETATVAKIGDIEYATLQKAITAAKEDDTVVLMDNITLSSLFKITKKVTLDLNGKTLSSTANKTISLTASASDLIVKDSNGQGKICNESVSGSPYTISVENANAKFTLESGTIESSSKVTDFNTIAIYTKGTVNIDGGKVITPEVSAKSRGIVVGSGAKVNISNGEIIGGGYAVYLLSNSVANIKGGSFTSRNDVYAIHIKGSAAVTIGSQDAETVPVVNGIDFESAGSDEFPAITLVKGKITKVFCMDPKYKYDSFIFTIPDGALLEFSDDSVKPFLPENVTLTDNEDGTYSIGASKTYVAKIGDTEFESLQEAFDAANVGDTVTLLTDITLTEQVNITKALSDLTLDGNGKTITCATTTDPSKSGGSALYFGNADKKLYCTGIKIKDLTMTGTARFAIFLCGGTSTEFTNVKISGKYLFAINLYGTHGAVMNNCDISNSFVEDTYGGAAIWTNVASANPLVLNNTKVSVIAINAYTTDNTLAPKIFVNDGSEAIIHTFDDGTVSKNKLLCVSEKSTGKYTVQERVNGEWVNISVVAEVNGVKYETLQAAIDAAKSGATVTLVADAKENVTVEKNAIVLNLNGYTLNGGTEKGKPALAINNKKVTVKDSSVAQTGTIKRDDTNGAQGHYVIDIQGKNGFLLFEGGNVENDSGVVGVRGASLVRLGNDSVSGAYPVLTIRGGKFTQNNFIAIKVDRGTLHLQGGEVNSANSYAIENWNNAYVEGGTVNGTVSSWVYSTGAAFSKLTISSGKVNGNVASVNYDDAADKQARIFITGGEITGTLGIYTYNNGLNPITDNTKATIEVTGGTFDIDPTRYVTEAAVVSGNEDGKFGVEKVVLAKIGDTEYYTMDNAFHAVKAGETIVMQRDYKTDSVQNSGSKSFTIDLNGHTWTYTRSDADCAAFEINYSDVTLTVKNGKVISNTLVGLIPTAMSGTITYNNSALIFEEVEMTANGHCGIETNGGNTNDTVTLKNSTLNVPNGYGIYFASSGTLNIESSTINAKTMGVQVCAGSLNISGDSEITVTGDPVAKTENDGAIEDGAAISIVNRPGYKGLVEVTITGGTFKSAKGKAIKAYKWENKEESDFDLSVIAVSGGTFSSAVPADYCADGFIPKNNGDGTYGVEHKAATGTRNLSVEINGYGKVDYSIIGGVSGTWDNSITNVPYEIGTQFTLKAIPGDGFTFLYWVNSEGRVLTDNLTYNFYLGDNLTIKAVFCKTENSNAYVIFRDRGNTILKATSADSEGYIDVPTNLIDYAGYTFIGWYDADGKEYIVTDGKIQVSGNTAITIYARYKADTETLYTVTVGGVKQGEYRYGSYVTVTAEDIEGKEFAGWYINGTLVSYDKAYSFYVTGDVALEARYADTVVVKEPVVTLLVSARKDTADGKQSVILTASWSADSSYTFVGAGIILSQNADAELTLENVDGKNVVKTDTRLTSNDGTYAYTLTLGTTAKLKNVYAVAYFTFIKDGKVVTIYTTVQISEAI